MSHAPVTATKRRLTILSIVGALLIAPQPAAADATAFIGVNPTPSNRAVRGLAVGVSMLVVGFEFEYSDAVEDLLAGAPGLRTGMGNVLVQTPTDTQLYVTAGGGAYRERLDLRQETNIVTNIGGGIKLKIAGPLRVRVDYRLFKLRGDALHSTPQRVYVGANLAF